MGMKRQGDEWDEEYEVTRARYKEARRVEGKARAGLGQARTRHERVRGIYERARNKVAEARSEQEKAQSRVEEARRKAEDARRKGLPRHRWESEMRRSEDDAQRRADEVTRWGDEARRQERQPRALANEVRELLPEVEELTKVSHHLEQRLDYLTKHPPGTRDRGPSTLQEDSRSLSVTESATAVLRDMLDKMERRPGQALRLVADSEGSFTLSLDTERRGDEVVSHEGTPVLLIETPIPESLLGSTLDVNETPQGAQIVLSR